MLNIITTEKKWNETLKKFDSYDFYHTYEYHQLSKKSNETAILLTYIEGLTFIALPLLKRPILNTSYFDATSVYGYAGPLISGITNFENNKFKAILLDFFNRENIISVFSRLNPFITNQNTVLKNIGKIEDLGVVVNIDITKELDIQRSKYSKSTKSRVNKARKICYMQFVKPEEHIETFLEIYNENMNRLGAHIEYYFDEKYFSKFFKSNSFKTDLAIVFVKDTNEPIAASIFVKTNNIVQFHLSGTKTEYLHLAPARLFIDEMRIKATNEGYKYFNLGGGLGGVEDSLFNFKSSFSKDYLKFTVWKLITNKEKYLELCNENSEVQKLEKETNFFPLYRFC